MSHISYSAFKDYCICPYYYKLVRIDNIKGFEGNVFTTFGSAIHKTCQDILKSIDKDIQLFNNQFELSFLKELLILSQEEIKEKKSLIKDMRIQGKEIIKEVISAFKNYFDDYELVAIEYPLYEQIGENNINFKGFIDLIIKSKNDDKYHIIDLKSTSWGWQARKKGDKYTVYQLIFYKYYYSQKLNINMNDINVHFGLLKRTAKCDDKIELFKVTSGGKRTENAIKLLNEVISNIQNKKFWKRRKSCADCVLCGKECNG